MKNFLPLLFILLFQFGNAQEPYLPLLTDSILWENVTYFNGFDGTRWTTTYGNSTSRLTTEERLHKDSIFRVFRNDYDSSIDPIFLYEDTLNRKVYARKGFDEFEDPRVLIYDFNLMEGDTFRIPYLRKWTSYWEFDCSTDFLVTKVEYRDYFGIERKTISLEMLSYFGINLDCDPTGWIPEQLTIIEGIGCSYFFDFFNPQIYT